MTRFTCPEPCETADLHCWAAGYGGFPEKTVPSGAGQPPRPVSARRRQASIDTGSLTVRDMVTLGEPGSELAIESRAWIIQLRRSSSRWRGICLVDYGPVGVHIGRMGGRGDER
jgi:hypothetical protein